MSKRPGLALCVLALLLGLAAHKAPARPIPARPANDKWQTVVNEAAHTVALMHHALGRRFVTVMKAATAVLIAPKGDKGDALLLIRDGTGWSEPAFFDATAFPSAAPSVLLICRERALNEILHQRGLTLSGPAKLALARVTGHGPADMLLWPGRALNPDGFLEDDAANASWYGMARTAPEIVGATPPDLRTSKLRAELEKKGTL